MTSKKDVLARYLSVDDPDAPFPRPSAHKKSKSKRRGGDAVVVDHDGTATADKRQRVMIVDDGEEAATWKESAVDDRIANEAALDSAVSMRAQRWRPLTTTTVASGGASAIRVDGNDEASVDQSPPRQRRRQDQSPPRRRQDQSPPRRRHEDQSPRHDQSPPRKTRAEVMPQSARATSTTATTATATTTATPKMASGANAGLQSASAVTAAQHARKSAELAHLTSLPPSLSGRLATTVYRDASGKIIDERAERARLDEERRAEEERERRVVEGRKGTVQKRADEERRALVEEMKSAPFARRIDDAKMNAEMKERRHWDDPLKMPSSSSSTRPSGSSTNTLPRKPQYTGPPGPPNRFHIPPGYRWDGVDRGNRFEAKWFQAQSARSTRTLDAHKWSTEDM